MEAPQEHSVRLAQVREAFLEPAGRAARRPSSRRHRGPFLQRGGRGDRRADWNADVPHRPSAGRAPRDGGRVAGAHEKPSQDCRRSVMTGMIDPVTEADLDAYVDDQLDVARRIEIEAYLSTRPAVAARVMSDLRTRDELRLALAGPKGMARQATSDAARRLERGLARGRVFSALQRAAAVAVLRRRRLAGKRDHRADVGDRSRRVNAAALLRGRGDAGAQNNDRPGVDGLAARSARLRCRRNPRRDRHRHAAFFRRIGRSRTSRSIPRSSDPALRWRADTKDFGLVSLFAVRPRNIRCHQACQSPLPETFPRHISRSEKSRMHSSPAAISVT